MSKYVFVLLVFVFSRALGEDSSGNEECQASLNENGSDLEGSGGWSLIQRHNFTFRETKFANGSWQDYKLGFGRGDGKAFWLGLETLHTLTSTGRWKMRVKIKYDRLYDWEPDPRKGTWGVGIWSEFYVGSEEDKYKLHIGRRSCRRNMGPKDPFIRHNGKPFSSLDVDNDGFQDKFEPCAVVQAGGWWFGDCSNVCLNCSPWADWRFIWMDTPRRRFAFPEFASMEIKKVEEDRGEAEAED